MNTESDWHRIFGRAAVKSCGWVAMFAAVGCVTAGAQALRSEFALAGGGSQSVSAYDVYNSLPSAPLPQSTTPAQSGSDEHVTLRATPANILHDQAAIWTSPFRVRESEMKWLVPVGLVTAIAITTDHQAVTSVISRDHTFNNDNAQASNVLTGALIAAPVALLAHGRHDPDGLAREAGILGGESLVDGVVVEQGLKLIFWRERPSVDGSRGRFFQSSAGIDSSFPSSHSVLAWSSAAALADESSSTWTRLGLYTAAAGVSLTRLLSQEHFPSDVVVGSAVGWMIGHYVVRKHRRHRDEVLDALAP